MEDALVQVMRVAVVAQVEPHDVIALGQQQRTEPADAAATPAVPSGMVAVVPVQVLPGFGRGRRLIGVRGTQFLVKVEE